MGSEANRDSNGVDAGSLGELSGHQCRSLPSPVSSTGSGKGEKHNWEKFSLPECTRWHVPIKASKRKSSLPNLPVAASAVFQTDLSSEKTLQVFDVGPIGVV